jgi:hypothetical protein
VGRVTVEPVSDDDSVSQIDCHVSSADSDNRGLNREAQKSEPAPSAGEHKLASSCIGNLAPPPPTVVVVVTYYGILGSCHWGLLTERVPW